MKWDKLLSANRLGKSKTKAIAEGRSSFHQDYDRVVFSSAFRRLQDKTQVFPLAKSDYVRTRLTHSLEASCVGRSLGMQVGLRLIKASKLSKRVDASGVGMIVSTACLAHDIGNPPFGHAGEQAICEWFERNGRKFLEPLTNSEKADFLKFEGNAQGFRILTRLQHPDNEGGLQLTYATLAAFSKYPTSSVEAGSKNAQLNVGAKKTRVL
jgi:dGTPase